MKLITTIIFCLTIIWSVSGWNLRDSSTRSGAKCMTSCNYKKAFDDKFCMIDATQKEYQCTEGTSIIFPSRTLYTKKLCASHCGKFGEKLPWCYTDRFHKNSEECNAKNIKVYKIKDMEKFMKMRANAKLKLKQEMQNVIDKKEKDALARKMAYDITRDTMKKMEIKAEKQLVNNAANSVKQNMKDAERKRMENEIYG